MTKSRGMRWVGNAAHKGEKRNAYRVFVRRPEGKVRLGRPRHRWEDDIKVDLIEKGWDSVEWINLPRDRDQ
jgi:hypothetical protein